MNRSFYVGFLMLMLSGMVLQGCKREEGAPKAPEEMTTKGREDAAPRGIEMKLTPSKSVYELEEQIVIMATLTNQGSTPCRIVPMPEVSVHILELSLDGKPLVPSYTIRNYYVSFEDFIVSSLVPLKPRTSSSFSLVSRPGAIAGIGVPLMSAPLHPNNTGLVMHWRIDRPGTYTLVARNVLPLLTHLPSDFCQPPEKPVTTSFTVRRK